MSALDDAHKEQCRRSLSRFVRLAWPHAMKGKAYSHNWHVDLVCDLLQREEHPDTVINVPPGTMKSLLTEVFFPAWRWGPKQDARARFMFVSFDATLLNQSAERQIELMSSEWYVRLWGYLLSEKAPGNTLFKTTRGGFRINTTIDGKATGHHVDYQFFSDPVKPADANRIGTTALDHIWDTMSNTFASRTDNPLRFLRYIVMQRLHEDDPAGRAIAAGWHSLILPMLYQEDAAADPRDPRTQKDELLWPDRFSAEACAKLKHDCDEAGLNVWDCQYLQRPSKPGGQIIQAQWVIDNTYTSAGFDFSQGQMWHSWDLAFKDKLDSDNIAGQPWLQRDTGGKAHYFLHPGVFVGIRSFVASLQEVAAMRAAIPARKCYVEDKANGPALESVLSLEWPNWIELVNPLGPKPGRLHACAPVIKAGRVHLPADAPGFDRLLTTITRFPRVRYDDEIDAMTQLLLRREPTAGYWASLQALVGR